MLDPREILPETTRPLRRAEYERLVALGVFEGERVELLYGVIVQMSPHGPPHDSVLDRLTKLFVQGVGDRARVRIQSSFAASDGSEPEPDAALVPERDYDDGHPDVAYLIVEVAESSLNKDRGVKAKLYAESNVSEYWVVNLVDRRVEVFRAPASGRYTEESIAQKGEVLRPLAFPDLAIPVDAILRG